MPMRIVIRHPGGPDCLIPETFSPDAPGVGQVLVRHQAIGVNFIDVYHRRGRYPLAGAVPGVEAAGIVEAVGTGVAGLSPGDAVVYGGPPAGGYADRRVIDAGRLHPLPGGVAPEIAAAGFFKGLTAHMLLKRVFPVGPGTRVLVHAAAGGLGGMVTRWAKHLGAQVFGTVGSPAKADFARAAGADHVVVGRDADFAAVIAGLTDGQGVDFAIDGIGGATLAKTFAAVRKFGTVASIGEAAGPIPPVDVTALGPVRALTLVRPSVMAYAAEADTYRRAGQEVLAMMAAGMVNTIGRTFPLDQAALAHAELEAGRTMGGIVLTP